MSRTDSTCRRSAGSMVQHAQFLGAYGDAAISAADLKGVDIFAVFDRLLMKCCTLLVRLKDTEDPIRAGCTIRHRRHAQTRLPAFNPLCAENQVLSFSHHTVKSVADLPHGYTKCLPLQMIVKWLQNSRRTQLLCRLRLAHAAPDRNECCQRSRCGMIEGHRPWQVHVECSAHISIPQASLQSMLRFHFKHAAL